MAAFNSKRDLSGLLSENREFMEEMVKQAGEVEVDFKEFGEKREELKEVKSIHDSNPTPESKRKLDTVAAEARSAKEKVEADNAKLTNAISSFSSTNSLSKRATCKLLKLYHDQKENERLENIFKFSQSIDLCFVIDASGSMHVDKVFIALKKNIRRLLEIMHQYAPLLDFQLSLVAYRDPEDSKHLEVLPFTTSRTEFEQFVDRIESVGGGDECEDVLGGLKAASELNWLFCNRLLFLCGDAPCHGSEFHNGCGDSHPTGLPGIVSREIMHKLVQQKVQMTFWKINNSTDKMIERLNADAAVAPDHFFGNRSRDRFIESIQLDISNPEAIFASVKDSITKTAAKSLSASSSQAGGLKPKELKNTMKQLQVIHEGEEDDEISRKLDHAKLSSASPAGSLISADGKRI